MKNYITKINKEIFCPNFPNTNGFIKNMDDFLNEHTNENKQFNWRYNKPKLRLANLKTALSNRYENWADPVEYLYYLYYERQIDFRWIEKIIKNELELDFPNTTLSNMFRKTFKWKPRWKHEETPWKNQKDKNKSELKGTWWLSKLNRKRVKETKDEVDAILEKSKWNSFSIDVFNTKWKKINKLTYIFYSFWIIKDETNNSFISLLRGLKKNFWSWRITNIIINIIEKLELKLDIKIDWKEIDQWLK